jgi:PAS domain S-box-containing protein
VTDAASILDSVGDAVIALDQAGRVILWSRAAELLFGRPESEVEGRQLADLGIGWTPGESRKERRLTLQGKNGRAFSAAVNTSLLAGAAGEPEGKVVLVKDLEPWIGPIDDLAEPVEGLDVDERLGATFRGVMEATGADFDPGESIDQLAPRLAIQGRRLVAGAECMIAVVPPDRQDTFFCLGAAGPAAEQLLGRAYPLEGSIAGRAISAKRPRESIRMNEEGADPGLLASFGIRTLRAVPLLSRQPLPDGRTALGALTLLRREAVPFSAKERRLIDDFGALVTLSIQRAEFRVAADRSMERLQLAIDVALDLAQSLDVRDVVRRLVRRATLGSRADRCVLLRIEGGDTVVEDAYDSAGHGDLAGYRQAVSAQELMAKAIYTRSPVLGGRYDLSAMPPALRQSLEDVRHTATMPLLYGGEVVAILVLSRRADPPFGREEVETLRLLSGPAALALRNSFLYAQTHEAGRVKSDFLDMAAHELRSPLTVIGGYLSMLREEAFGPAPASWALPLQALDLKVAELARLVEDLLMAARLETGRLASVIEAVDLGAAAHEVAAGAREPVLVTAPEAPVRALTDRLQLYRILEHLVGNALAYARSGAPAAVSIQVTALEDRRQARLLVEDQGRGMSEEFSQRIFERFQRIEDPDQPAVPGTGLGLYIARELAERHGGSLELEWTLPGRGSRFALHLPLATDRG